MLTGKMGETLKCEVCEEEATVHLTQIIDNHIQKVDLCEKCAKEKGVTDPSGFSLADLLTKPHIFTEALHQKLVCEKCGFSPADFKRLGQLGCPACYGYFRDIIDPILSNMHMGTKHSGKVPSRSFQQVSMRERISGLKLNLEQAIEAERYEEAARYRDEIEQLGEVTKEKSDG